MDPIRQQQQLSFPFGPSPLPTCAWCGQAFAPRSFGTNRFCKRGCYHAQLAHQRDNPPDCCVPGCPKKAYYKTRKLCSAHYWRLSRHGRVEPEVIVVEPMSLTPTEAAWLAGIIDGEGHIGMMLGQPGQSGYSPRVYVVNTDQRMLQRMFDVTGFGSVRHRSAEGKAREKWLWTLNGIPAIHAFLKAIRPYLVTKGEQADLLLSLPVEKRVCPEFRQEVYMALRRLNRRGNVDPHEPIISKSRRL